MRSTHDVRVQGCTFAGHTQQRLHAQPDYAPEPPLLPRVIADLFAVAQLVEVRRTLPNTAPVLREVDGPREYERATCQGSLTDSTNVSTFNEPCLTAQRMAVASLAAGGIRSSCSNAAACRGMHRRAQLRREIRGPSMSPQHHGEQPNVIEGQRESIHTCLAPSSSATARGRPAGASDRSTALATARAPFLPSAGSKPGVPVAKPLSSIMGPLSARSRACRRTDRDQYTQVLGPSPCVSQTCAALQASCSV